MSRQDIIDKIYSQRGTIEDHIEKYERYQGTDKRSALITIQNAQRHIEKLKDLLASPIDDDDLDTWEPDEDVDEDEEW